MELHLNDLEMGITLKSDELLLLIISIFNYKIKELLKALIINLVMET